MLGSFRCEVLSVLDLKDAFHSLRLLENSKRFCGTLPYFGSTSYLYQRMPMGLNISPSIWQPYVKMILDCLQSRIILQSNNGQFIIVYPNKEITYSKIRRSMKGIT